MAGKDISNPVDVNNPSSTRRSSDLLPGYIRTDRNSKFLASTLDQFIQPPQLERIDGFVGSKLSLNYKPSNDQYIAGTTKLRTDYQLEPSLIINDDKQQVNYALGYDDLINQLAFNNADVSNLNRLFKSKSYSYDPMINWDKFVNFRQYYWLPTGPDTIEITGRQKSTVSTYTVSDSPVDGSLIFTPDGTSNNPLLTLYRGMTYVFNVNSAHPFYIKTAYSQGPQDLYSGVTNNGTRNGQLILTVDEFTPNTLFYFADGNLAGIGQFVIKTITENTTIDIENDVLGKQTYTSETGVTFSNGMKVRFVGTVTPTEYLDKEFIVEGVGSKIVLVDYASLQPVGVETTNLDPNFDATPFDLYPFDNFSFIPLTPEYVTINRAAPDKNPWARFNCWVHADVIAATAKANGVQGEYPTKLRAQRPIIEFAAGLQLYNYGSKSKKTVNLIDNITTNAFKIVEGASGFYVDGVLLEAGHRVIFNADTDLLVRGKIYEVKISIVNNKQLINLEEVLDSEPSVYDAVMTSQGVQYAGVAWWFNGSTWTYAQQKTSLNQAPLFDLYDSKGNRYADQTVYRSSFAGSRLFGYTVGTGVVDPVLGFSLDYRNVSNVGEYLFSNYFMTDTFTNFNNNTIEVLNVADGFFKVNLPTEEVYRTVWVKTIDHPIPILQFQVLDADSEYVEITSIDSPGYAKDLEVELFVNDIKQIRNVEYIITASDRRLFAVATDKFSSNDRVLIKLYTASVPTANGYYEPPINLTNNPLNGSVKNFTFTELSDHVKTIADFNDQFAGTFPGAGNLRDLGDVSAYGSRLVTHDNPMSFAHYFLGTQENNIVNAVRKVSNDYNLFKANLIKQITELRGLYTPSQSLDIALTALNRNKEESASYGYSDMLAYGKNYSTRTFTVTDARNVQYSLASIFDTTVLSERSVLVYLENVLLVAGYDYIVSQYEPNIVIKKELAVGDKIVILDYPNTVGSYVPPTPTKLGLYPKFKPAIYIDDTYASAPQRVIQGHDGSITVAFTSMEEFAAGQIDYRDAVILEYETRVFNNLKVKYNPDLLDISTVLPGAFRDNSYSQTEVTDLVTADFLRWAGSFGVDYQTNNTLDELNSFTFNYTGSVDTLRKNSLTGYWRSIYKYFYDTDRPHTHPWEMLGFSEEPVWWTNVYGPAPYTSGNLVLWDDLEAGRIVQGDRAGINIAYARPGLSKIIPVNESGVLLSPTDSGLAATPIVNPNDPRRLVVLRSDQIANRWAVGDQGPAETAWRRSSYWPFACQVLMALAYPATYAAQLFDTSRIKKNIAGQYKYGDTKTFLNPSKVLIYRDVIDSQRVLASGYSVFVIEAGISKNINYLNSLKVDLTNLDYRLMVKLGGFASKEKLQVGIDAVDPTSPYPGALIPSEDYNIFFNKSNPIESLEISGLIIQKTGLGYSIRGYDKYKPYFTILKPFASNLDQIERVGGRSESYVTWSQNTTYNIGQIVFYTDRYYRVTQRHNSDVSFNLSYYQSLPYLPTVGGVGVSRRTAFDTSETVVPYGVEYKTIQEVYDLIVGYGQWLESKGFIFEEFNSTLEQILDWKFTAKEFLYWTTQNWDVNSIITLSPFANKLTLRSDQGVVENIMNEFYEYSLLKADGNMFSKNNFTLVRLDGEFSITTMNTQDGMFFARLNLVQKEHAVVMNNFTLFKDVVYAVETGYRQRRVKLKGFRTANWNGDFFSPGFVFDQAVVSDWQKFVDYGIGSVIRFSGKYYSAIKSIIGSSAFDITQWAPLNEKPEAQLLPNFDYKINQFEDFYSLDIDNFDVGQQSMAQHLIGYTPRPYLNYIISDPTAQYKFYQGFIRDKGSKKSLTNLSKASFNNFRSSIDFNEEWAFRIGYYGGYNTYQELETSLESTGFIENPQILQFVENKPVGKSDTVYYKDEADAIIKPENFNINLIFPTIETTLAENNFKLPVAGYVRFDDVTSTAYNKNSILDIANNSLLKVGTTIWLGFREDGEWDVLRLTEVPTIITAVAINVVGESLTISTYYPHQQSVGDLISITRIARDIDRCYVIDEVLGPNQFVVRSTIKSMPPLPNTIRGLMFSFDSSRLRTFDDLSDIKFLDRWALGEKVWVDDDGTGKWVVYKKSNNYQATVYSSIIPKSGQHYASTIVTDDKIVDGRTVTVVVASAPDFQEINLDGDDLRGRVFISVKDSFGEIQSFNNYNLNEDVTYYSTATSSLTNFGQSLAFNATANLVVAGAPATSNVKTAQSSNGFIVNTDSEAIEPFAKQGVVKLSVLNAGYREIDSARVVITTPIPQTGAEFGTSIALSSTSTTNFKLLVGAPGQTVNNVSSAGAVYIYNVVVSTATIAVTTSTQSALLQDSTNPLIANSEFGTSISGNASLTRVAVSAPGYFSNSTTSTGAVFVYDFATTSTPTIITGEDAAIKFGSGDQFGPKVTMTKDGEYLIVASYNALDPDLGIRSGVVDIFKWNSVAKKFKHHQRIGAPISAVNSTFVYGYDISISESGDTLVISSVGNSRTPPPTFDKYTERYSTSTILAKNFESIYVNNLTSDERNSPTTFDSGATTFSSNVINAGTVHVYNRLGTGATKWAHAQSLYSSDIVSNSMFGRSVFATNNSVYVGAPAKLLNGNDGANLGIGQLFSFDKIDNSINSWALYRNQAPSVDLEPITRAITIDSNSEQIQYYIDIIDPIKGKVLGTAAEELRYVTSYDPAIYSLGILGVNVNSNTNWLDEHVGELWWDLSSVKYVWYEQGELEYRKNNWNNIFPGSSIDVYEWVRSEYLPAEWSQLADTADGLTQGVSGQPKFVDNSVISVKQVYNSVSNAFTNVYYYWVKNKVTVPTKVANRNRSAFDIANQIADPLSSGLQFLAVISPTSVMLANIKSVIASEQINLNISFDLINDSANRHTEWLLLEENNANSKPNWLLEKKLIDSLLGHDSLGNPVPDPTLPNKLQYGIEVRPRQSLFVNRREALRNIIEFVNDILSKQLITGQINFANLNAVDDLPNASTYDSIVEDIFTLELISTKSLITAELQPVIDSNGKITNVTIVNAGYGYLTTPTVSINGTGFGAEISLTINSFGSITEVNIINAGTNYTADTEFVVRPYTTVVQTDSNSANKWAVYEWSANKSEWIKIRTQDFNTTLFWKYIDWSATDYDPLKEIISTVSSVYALEALQVLSEGSYVKVLNGGDGRYLILKKTNGAGGSFEPDWDVVYSEKGTIKFLETIWNLSGTLYAWDEIVGFDQTQYDQAPDKEIEFILTALKDDIFISDRKVYWNQLFFKAVRYAMSEQKFLDWAFKTTFISVVNNSGSLDQVATYKLENVKYYEDFLKEIKPYHTKIRKFTEQYTTTELTNTFSTDFDLPSYYNTSTLNFNKVEFGNNLLLQYPWKAWYDNYAYGVSTIELYDSGVGYTETPIVNIVAAAGDTGHSATAVAFISLGRISRIIVTNPGKGYTATPTISINGGGSTVLTPARAYAQLGGSPVRSNSITMKFDRTTGNREIGEQYYTDTFVAQGENLLFNLTWVPVPNKELIVITRNGILQLDDSYTILYSTAKYNPQPNTEYTKQSATLRLEFIPTTGDVIKITYPKSLNLYNAASRIEDYYQPGPGMPGKDLSQLMTGLEYSGLIVDGLPFNFAGGWDAMPYASTGWDNYALENGYTSFVTTQTSTQTFVLPTLITTGTEVNVYVKSMGDSKINGQRIDSTSTTSLVQTLIGLGTGAVDKIEVLIPGIGYSNTYTTFSISAPNTVGGTNAAATMVINSGSVTSFVITNPGSGYTEPPTVTIVESINPNNSTSTITLPAIARAVLKAEFTAVGSTATTSTVTIPDAAFTTTSTLVMFRYADSDGTVLPTDQDSLDAVVSGGNLAYTTALGLSPSEIILDGGSQATRSITGMMDDGFLNSINSHAPEECVPGQIQEAVGISVYTQPSSAAPIITNRKYWADGTTLTYKLGVKPANADSVIAIFNNQLVPSNDYTIDYVNNTFTFNSNTVGTGWLSLTSMQLGTLTLLGTFNTSTSAASAVYTSVVKFADVGSVYVTVNGISTTNYTLSSYRRRARLTINEPGTIQAYLFNGVEKSFSEVTDQIIVTTSTTSTFVLSQPPGKVEPFHSQVIVTKNGLRLQPPVTTYYKVSNSQSVYDISQSIVYPAGLIDLQRIEVYVNGAKIPVGQDWNLDQGAGQIIFNNSVIFDNDVIAIVVKQENDYLIENNKLILINAVPTGTKIEITTFTNHDPNFIRTETFKGAVSNQYTMQRPILDSAYVWASYNGEPLIVNLDYTIDIDNRTVVLRNGLYQGPDDIAVITSFADISAKELIAYRIFKDMLGRTHYKRLSAQNSTELVQDLTMTATSITVQDSSVLTKPDPLHNLPGIVLIDGERIEFFTIVGNTLGQLRRSTLGTAPKNIYTAGTPVIDQGTHQTVPFKETVVKYTTATTTVTNAYSLLDSIKFDPSVAYSDQVEVRYQGRPLLKPGLNTTEHQIELGYDSTSTTTVDVPVPYGFTISSTSSVLTLNFTPVEGARLEVIKRTSRSWYNVPQTLLENTTDQAKFLLERPATLPDKYRYGQ
jgi:hypothetical protein